MRGAQLKYLFEERASLPPVRLNRRRARPHAAMTQGRFYEEGSRLLTLDAFDFMFRNELRRAVRSRSFLTLIVLDAKREWGEIVVGVDDRTSREVAQVVGQDIRETDLLGRSAYDTLSLVLLDVDFEQSRRVVARLVGHVDIHEFRTPLRITVGAACYPTHAVDADSLHQEAMSRPLLNWRRGTPPQ
jgi:GGDEF domain-containing protein